MRASKDIETIHDEVKKLLTLYPVYREDDRLLVCGLWSQRMGGKEVLKKMTAFELLTRYAKENLPNHDSITRAARDIKADHPELQGSNHQLRQDEQKPVQAALGYTVQA